MPAGDTPSYLDRLHGSHASLKAIFAAARMDLAEGRGVLDELERVIRAREATRYLEAHDNGYREGLSELLKAAGPGTPDSREMSDPVHSDVR